MISPLADASALLVDAVRTVLHLPSVDRLVVRIGISYEASAAGGQRMHNRRGVPKCIERRDPTILIEGEHIDPAKLRLAAILATRHCRPRDRGAVVITHGFHRRDVQSLAQAEDAG